MTLGPARVLEGHIKFLHLIDLDKYKETLITLNSTLHGINDPELESTKNTTIAKLESLKSKLNILYPKYRTKRGLINGAGTIIKSITGNLDADDLTQLNQIIEKINLNEHDLKSDMNKQVIINRKMIDRFKNITDYINNQQVTISNALSNRNQLLTNQLYREESSIQYLQYLNQINYNIDLLSNHITDIAEAIILAKLKVISKFILHPDELDYIHSLLNNMSFPIQSDEQIYELLELQAYYSGTRIIFNLNIPVISNEIFKHTHLIPLANNRKQSILINYPYITHNSKFIFYFTNKCKEIEQTYVCDKPSFKEYTNSSKCIGNIIYGSDANCQYIEMPHMDQITTPENDYILLMNITEKTITNTCGLRTSKVQGTALIHYENCSITINNITYSNIWTKHWDQIHIVPMMFNKINKTSVTKILTVEKLQEYHFENSDHIELLKIQIGNHRLMFYSYATLITITLVIFYFIKIKTNRNYPVTEQEPVIQEPPSQTLEIHSNMAPTIDPTLRINWMSPK